MPEGDAIHSAANRIRPVLAGHVPDEVATPHRRAESRGWPERLAGRAVTAVDAHGKHLLLRFEGDLVIHSHLRMTGRWRVRDSGRPWARNAWLVLRRGEREVLELNGPVLELMTTARARSDPRLAALGPDILAPELDEEAFLRRLREDDPTRPFGDALLDQRTIAGIGNLWKAEGCFEAAVDPWRRTGEVSDAEARAVVRACRTFMQRSVGGEHGARLVYRRAGRPCPRCGSPIRVRGQWEENRATFWCPGCQR